MTDLDQPATKRDVMELRQEVKQELRELGIKVDAYWQATQQIQRLAYATLAAGALASVSAAVALALR
jgi:hypothetical protein